MNSDTQYYNKERLFFDTASLSFFSESKSFPEKLFNRFYRESFDKAIDYIPESAVLQKTILEIGCNISRYLYYFKMIGTQTAIGCDLSLGVLKKALLPHHNFVKNIDVPPSKIHLIQALAEETPIKADAIDTLFCFRSLHHFLHKDLFIRQSYHALKDNGLIILVDPNGNNLLRLLANKVGKYFNYLTEGENACKPKELINDLIKNNFEVMSIKYYNVFSEPVVHLGELSKSHSKILYMFFSALLIVTNAIDVLLNPIVNRFFPRLGWSFVLIARKHKL
ncbi:MAG: methyltransferase domain-containing protein [Deltaproteobacteria bacterium]|nr:methyltransferase domain-containing protein [Deltaproteobacteria bacterium]MCL5791551.1 methyltransferase domain-containing protein [Deltaproteobacteria bacterium]